MAQKLLKCPKCDRRFSMPAHVARHLNTIHGAKVGGKKAAKRVPKVKVRGKVGRPKGSIKRKVGRPKGRVMAAGFTFGEGAAHLVANMQAYHGELLARRASLEGEIASIAAAVEALGGMPAARVPRKRRKARRTPPARRGRPPAGGRIREGSLTDFVIRVLRQSSKPMTPRDISAKVAKTGYKSGAKDLAKAVSNTLAKVKRVKRVGRGMYRL